jgi:hypothetical protein
VFRARIVFDQRWPFRYSRRVMPDAHDTVAFEPRARSVAADSPRSAIAIVLAMTLLFIGIRSFYLDADTPLWVGSYYARELYAEPPAKAHEARNYALFGKWHLNPVDNYQFWRAQSPVWVYPLTWVFKTFGTDYPQLRLYSTLYSAFGLAVMLWLAAGYLSSPALFFAGFVLAIDRVYFHYARVGLLEPAVNAWIAVAMLALLRAGRRVEWLIVAQLAFVLAFFTKQAALYVLPILGVANLWYFMRPSQNAREPRLEKLWRQLTALHALLIGGLSVAYMSTQSYRRAVAHNVNHMLVGDREVERRWTNDLASALSRVTDPEKYDHFWITVPLIGLLATATVLFWLIVLARQRRLDAFATISGSWFACACVAMLVISKSELRFWTLMFMPAALAAAAGLDVLFRAVATYGPRLVSDARAKFWVGQIAWLAFAIPLAITVARDQRGLRKTLGHPTFTLRDGAIKLRNHLGDVDATIVGLASPPLVLGTPYKNYYVRETFNSTRAALQKLGITHILLHSGFDVSRDIFRREFPRMLSTLRPSLVLPVRNLRLLLYPVGKKLVNYQEPPRRPVPRRPSG